MTRALGSASPKLRSVATAVAFASLYFLTATVTGSLAGDAGIAVLWPASGLYVGVMLVAPHRMWPALVCAAGVGSLAAYLHAGSSFEVSVAFAVPSAAEGFLAAVLVERIAGRRFALGGLHDLFALVVGGAVVANALIALSAGAVAAQSFDAPFGESWLRWWSADALGMLAVAPIITAPLRPGRPRPSRWWSRPRVAALGGLGAALVAMQLVSQGSALIPGADVGAQVYTVQAFLALLLLSSLALAASAAEREHISAELGRARKGSVEELDGARRRVGQLTAELAASRAEVIQAGRERERLQQELDALGRDLGLTVADRDRAQTELHESARELERLRADLGDALDNLAHARAGSRALEEELEGARAESRALADQLESAQAEQARTAEELAEATSERRRAEEEIALAAGRVEGLRAELQRTQRAHEDAELALEHARARFSERREQLERSLAQATEKLAGLEVQHDDHATELFSRYDERGTCLSASPAFARLLGYEPDELVGRPGAELLHPDDRARLARARASRSRTSFQGRLRRKAGDFVWVEVGLDPVWAGGGERLVELRTTVRDISLAA
jgi:PAS domain S-box-containing protein